MDHLPRWHVDPRERKSALWTDGRLLLWQHGRAGVQELEARSLTQARSLSASAETLWIAPVTDEWQQVLQAIKREDGQAIGKNEVTAAFLPKEKRGNLLVQSVDEWHRANVPAGAEGARTLARGLYLAADLLGVRLRITPAHTGQLLMRASLQAASYERRGVALDMPEEWKDRIAKLAAKDTGQLTPQMHYARAICEGEQGGAEAVTLSSYDRNMSFVSCAAEVPTGAPIETAAYQAGMLGAYCVDASAPADWPREVPGYIGVRTGEAYGAWPRAVSDAWAWSHQIRAAMAAGWRVEVREGFYWPCEQKHTALKPWSEQIWNARRQAREYRASAWGESARIAEAIIKQCGVSAIGALKPRKVHGIFTQAEAEAKDARILTLVPDEQGDWSGLVEAFANRPADFLYQPAWWATTVSLATERLVQGCRIAGARTLAAYVDGVLTTAPVPELAGEASKRGGWREQEPVTYRRADLQGAPSAIIRNLTRGVVDNGEEE